MADQVAELTEVRKKLYAAEEELGTAKAALVAVKDGDDAQQIVKAELGVAKAELGVAEAKLGVAEAKLGVAKAEWQAAPREEKGALEEIMKTAKKSVESAQNTVNSANIAYENALRAAAPPHGARRVLLPPLSNLSPPGSNEDDVKTFVTVAQLAPLLERKRTGDAVGQYKNLNGILGENCLNVWGEMCAISHLESSGGNSLSRAHIIPQAALKKEDSNFPVTPELREKINGGNFSTFNVITMDPTIEGWFDMGNFCVEASGKIVFNSKLQEAVHQCMAPWLPENVSDRISQCEPLMAAFAWHRQFVFQTPGGVRAMFGGSTGSSAKGGGVSEGGSQRGSGRSGGGGSAASQGTTNEEPQHQRPQGAHGTEGSALLDSVSKARGLSSQDKVLAWDAAEADTVCGDFEPHWIV